MIAPRLLPPSWKKLLRDLSAERERVFLMGIALGVSVLAIGVLLGAFQILSREILSNYEGTGPAWATLETREPIDERTLRLLAARPEVADVQARDVVLARVKVGDDWRPLTIFVSRRSDSIRINRFHPVGGSWPEPTGSLLLERTAVEMVGAGMGGTLEVRLPHGGSRRIPVAGLVHDPGLAPAYQERAGYAYVSEASMAAWGESSGMRELRVVFRGIPQTDSAILEVSRKLSTDLSAAGVRIVEIRVPRPHAHPHQAQMTTMLLMMVSFAFLALFLSSLLAATTVSAMMVRQRRELGILKALGADTNRVFSRFAAIVGALGIASFLVAWVPSRLGAVVFARSIAKLLNLEIDDASIPWTVPFAMAVSAVLVPLAACWIPLRRSGSVPARVAMNDHDAARPSLLAPSWLPVPVRDALRRPSRLAMSMGLLAVAGSFFLTAWNIRDGWSANLAKIWQTRHYDVEVRFLRPVPLERLRALGNLPRVLEAEPWGFSHAAFGRQGEVDVVRTWPDRSHGSLLAMSAPVGTRMVSFPLLSGRRLVVGDSDGVVLNHTAWNMARKPALGTVVELSLEGIYVRKSLRGVLEEIGSPGVAYLSEAALAEATGSPNAASMVRIRSSATSAKEREVLVQNLEKELAAEGLPVEMVVPFSELRTAVGDHVLILVRSLLAIAGLMGLVGMLGLAATAGMNVLERTREIGVMKALGATPGALTARVLRETFVVSATSGLLGVLASIPLTLALDRLIGMLGFLAPLPLVVSWGAILLWAVLVAGVSLVAAWVPARRAGRLVVREALARL